MDLPESCSVLVTDKVRRTYKFLCIMGQGKPIVSRQWLVQSQRSGRFLGMLYVLDLSQPSTHMSLELVIFSVHEHTHTFFSVFVHLS